MSYSIGQGYDVHQLKPNLPLILGGVSISHSKGILAHSDGDILVHAIIDAILGACNLGDIGLLFPNDDTSKDMSGLLMLTKIKEYFNIKLLLYLYSIRFLICRLTTIFFNTSSDLKNVGNI